MLAKLRPYLMILSVALIAFGFWQARRAKQCNRRPRILNLVLLWTAALFVFVSLAFPQVLAEIMAG